MVASEFYGLSRFKKHFEGLEDSYAVIGGAACDILLSDADLDFRATKDLDIVLLVENRLPEIGRAIWRLVKAGGYSIGQTSSGKPTFYRFSHPSMPGYPSLIEVFSTAQAQGLDAPDAPIIPLHLDEGISSLSAILLDEDYYKLMRLGRKTIDGVSVLDEKYLIPFKARAFNDLSARKAHGDEVSMRDIRKHKNDVFRLMQLLRRDERVSLPPRIEGDMRAFFEMMHAEEIPLKQLGISMKPADALAFLEGVYLS